MMERESMNKLFFFARVVGRHRVFLHPERERGGGREGERERERENADINNIFVKELPGL